MDTMTTQSHELVPEFTLGDRLRKARSMTGLTTREFAERIGVSHGTITAAETDKRAVRRITLNACAMATGVSLQWLESGSATTPPPTGGGQPGGTDALADLTQRKRRRAGAPATPQYQAA